jgi:23S rRNA (cytidine1920-2'-O)/16S rRNA (cytidine1409-2'-O)-methyltransferase
MAKLRADHLLVRQGLCATLDQAKAAILAGQVRASADHVVHRATEVFPPDTILTLTASDPFVSRGAGKLLPALDRYLPSVSGLVALDLGASTGGFTDLLVQRGAARVYAVDVGVGLLHWRLRQDPRVVVREGVNARHLSRQDIPEPINLVTADLSFISLRQVLPAIPPLLAPEAWIMVLVKPQFEAARDEVAKGGVVRDPLVRARVIEEIKTFCTANLGWQIVDCLASPVLGPKGNQESILVARAGLAA